MGITGAMKARAMRWLQNANAPLQRMQERQTVMQAQLLAKNNSAIKQLRDLGDVEFSAFSQWGEDGIIDWLVSRLPDIPKTFVEFGVEDYRESNTRFLLQTRNWRGLIMDGSEAHIRDIRGQDIYWRHSLSARCAFIDRDNINQLLREGGMSGEIGLLSVDIDGNDYWVWQAIGEVCPAIVVAEFNAVLGDLHALTVPYRPDFQRTQAHHSNLYFGASLPALIELATQKGYFFVGTTSTGCNAFFIRKDLASSVTEALSGIWAYPSKVREARDAERNLLFVDGDARPAMIATLPLIDLRQQSETSLSACGTIYSPEWQSGNRRGF